jgi:hypothetical protein
MFVINDTNLKRGEGPIEVVLVSAVIAAHGQSAELWMASLEAVDGFNEQRFFDVSVEPADDGESKPATPERGLSAA